MNIHCPFQVRSPFPMIPIGGIQMVHSVPTSVTSPLAQQGAREATSRLVLQKSTSEDSTTSEAERGVQRGGGGGERRRESAHPQESEGGARLEQEENIHTCTKAIASLCIDSGERGGGGRASSSSSSSSPSVLSPSSQQQQQQQQGSPSPPQGPGIQHFRGLEPRPPYPLVPSSPSSHPPSPGSESLQPSLKLEREGEDESTKRSRDAS